MPSHKRHLLPIAVFLTGASVLIVEVAAVRVLSPYYGNTIFTVSGVISVILLALSAGYYAGGVLADRHPSPKMFFRIVFASGVVLLASYALGAALLARLSEALPMTSGPLASAALLFLLPALLLGMLSPFAVKLQSVAFPEEGVGTASGKIFFWSTLGSIVGSLAAGFVLIPRLGVSRILIADGAFLCLLGLVPLSALHLRRGERLPYRSIAAFIFALAAVAAFGPEPGRASYQADGLYERLTVFDGVEDGRPARFLLQDRSVSGAMWLDSDDPSDLVYGYTKYYALHRIFAPKVENALVIGGGAYSIPKALAAELPEAAIDVSEIEPSLFDLAKERFSVPETPRLSNHVEDGRRLLATAEKKYDLIFSDVYYSYYSVPAHFTTKEFFALAKERLSGDGVFIASMIGDLSRQRPSLIMAEIKTFRSVFPNSRFFAVTSPESVEPQNIILVGSNGGRDVDLEAPEILNGDDPLIRSLRDHEIDLRRFDLSPYPVLTDDFSPVEYLTARVLRRALDAPKLIDGKEMLAVVDQQLRYGPRHLSAPGHARTQEFLAAEMRALTPEVKVQAWEHAGPDGKTYGLKNVIARFFPERKRRIVLATHYDSKKFADMDPARPDLPVPGANDSGSGVAVLTELARAFAHAPSAPEVGVDIVFFDGEEGEEDLRGSFEGWKPLGSTHFTERLTDVYGGAKPAGGIVLDLVCDKDLRLPKEPASMRDAPAEVEAFWALARKTAPGVFADDVGPEIEDDHTTLNAAGIPSFLVIDYAYPHFHTTRDTLDTCDARSLETVGRAVYDYVYSLRD